MFNKDYQSSKKLPGEISGNQQSAEVAYLTSEKHNADAIHGIRVGTRFEEPIPMAGMVV